MVNLVNRVICINNKKTSMRMTLAEWDAFEIICKNENVSKSTLLNLINNNKNHTIGLTNSVRLFSIVYFHQLLKEKQQMLYGSSKKVTISPIFHAIKEIV